MRTKQGDGAMSSAIGPQGFQDAFKPYENLAIIRLGAFDEAEMAFLARGAKAAIAWSHTQAVQVILEHQRRHGRREVRRGHVGLHGQRAAGQSEAAAGQGGLDRRSPSRAKMVDFTLRFDNIGNQPLGNVAILDSLSTRLEYVSEPEHQCSVDAKFSTQPNEGGSVVVRCELDQAASARPGRHAPLPLPRAVAKRT